MKQEIKIAIIGSTGKSGKYLLKQLLNHGFSCKILLRQPANFQIKDPLIEIVQGDARDYSAVYSLVAGCGAVISTLGQPKNESSIFSAATKNVISAMNQHRIRRYILTTGLSVDTPFDLKSEKTKYATGWMKANYPETTLDKQTEYNALYESNLDWTLVRLPLIEQTEKINEISISLKDCPGDKISSTDLALFLVGQLSDGTFIKQSPFIASI